MKRRLIDPMRSSAPLQLALHILRRKMKCPSFLAYVDSDLCARLMLGPITTARVDCSMKTYKDGSNAVLVRLDDNTVFDVNKEKMVKDHVGGFGEAAGEVKVKSGTMKLRASHRRSAVKSPPVQPSGYWMSGPTRRRGLPRRTKKSGTNWR